MRLSHILARLEKQHDLFNLISNSYDNLVNVDSVNLTVTRIKTRIESLEDIWQQFSIAQDAINIAVHELPHEEENKVKAHSYYTNNSFVTAYENYIYNVEKMRSLLDLRSEHETIQETTLQSTPSTSSTIPTTCFHQPRLPRIELPKFNGNPSEWLSFKDLFNSLAVSNPSLTEVGRLQYLKTSLVGPAVQLLKNTTLTADNFQKAWDALISFYENKRLLINAALHSLLNIKRMTRESAMELELLYTNMMQIYRTLETLQRPVSSWDDFLVFIATQRLDAESVKAWEQQLGSTREPPTWAQFSDFLITRLRSLQAFEKSRPGKSHADTGIKPNLKTAKSFYQGKPKEDKTDYGSCVLCKEKHYITACPQYRTKTRNQKLCVIQKYQLCFNCLGAHRSANCVSTRRCRKCGKKHHSSIHVDYGQEAKIDPNKLNVEKSKKFEEAATAQSKDEARVLHSNVIPRNTQLQTLLATVQILVLSPNGEKSRVRALMDQGSEVSLVKESLAQRLKLPRIHSSITFVGLGAQPSNKSRGLVQFKIKPHFTSDFESTVSAHVLPSLTSLLPSTEISERSWTHLKGLQLADPQFSTPGSIEVIIGADFYGPFLSEGVVKGPSGTPVAQCTYLGWIISGPTNNSESSSQFQSYHISYNGDLCKLMQRFWELEAVPSTSSTVMSAEETDCEEHFKKTYSRDTSGRYTVRLPFKDSVNKLGDSKRRAILLHNKLTQRLSTDTPYSQKYLEFMREYEQLKHMKQVPTTKAEPLHCYYLPHHGVWKENSLTTKLRVVYNGSSPTSTGYSLNDILHTGAKLQTDIFEVLLWFR